MLSYRKQMMLISLFVLVFISLGLFTTYHNMKKITQWPVEEMLLFKYDAGIIKLKIIGLDIALENIAFPRMPFHEKVTAAPAAAAASLTKLFQDTRRFSFECYAVIKEFVVDKISHFR